MADIFLEVKEIESKIIEDRRYLHQHAEIGFELPKTTEYVVKVLKEIGCEIYTCGKSGIYTVIGKKESDAILLRADLDALPIQEETNLNFKSNKNMHACGHDMHTAMLLGAARILKMHESELKRRIKLLFQPAEETLSGAKNMIENGILENPSVKAAFMLHVITGSPIESGGLIIQSGGNSAPSADYFEITIKGAGCHGAMPESGRDPIATAVRIVTSLDTIKSRELSFFDNSVLTIGAINSGTVHNIIPDNAKILGTIRTFDENTRNKIKDSIVRISNYTAKALNTTVEVFFSVGCPCLHNDEKLSSRTYKILSHEIPKVKILTSEAILKMYPSSKRSVGSEDFAYYSQNVPSLMIGLSAGSEKEGYNLPLHNPKVIFNEDAMIYGTTALCELAMNL